MTIDCTLELENELQTVDLAKKMASCLVFPCTIALSGELGSGKTAFIRALIQALGVTGRIKSPTFSLVESYASAQGPIHHFDLYRIHCPNELDYIGFRDFFTGQALCCIEWPERALAMDSIDLQGLITIQGDGRLLQWQALSVRGENVLSCLVGRG